MAVEFTVGFDNCNVNADISAVFEGTEVATPYAISTDTRFNSGKSITLSGNYANKDFSADRGEMWFGFALKFDTFAERTLFLSVMSSTRVEGGLAIRNNGLTSYTFYESSNQSGNKSFNYNFENFRWYWIDVRIKSGNPNGEVEMWVDGVQVGILSNVRTTLSANGTLFKRTRISCNSGNVLFDDFSGVSTTGGGKTTRLGDSRVVLAKVNSDATPNDGTPTPAGAHYACVADNGFITTNYIDIATPGQAEMFGLASFGVTPTVIMAAQVCAYQCKTGSEDAFSKLAIRSGATTDKSANISLSAQYKLSTRLLEVDPNTSAAWTISAVNAMNVGVEMSS